MYISKFQVLNFKSYRDSNEILFKPGFNIITGQNSAGKTALLEAMTLQFVASPHRSLSTVPTPGIVPPQDSVARVTFSLTRDELFSLLRGQPFLLPEPQEGFPIPGYSPYRENADGAGMLQKWLSQEQDFSPSLQLRKLTNETEIWTAEGLPLGKYPPQAPVNAADVRMLQFQEQDNKLAFVGYQRAAPTNYLAANISGSLRTWIYRFRAERFNLGLAPFGGNSILAPDAQNLPEAVNTLNADPRKLLKLNELLSEILPQVRQISVRPFGSQVQIIVWSHDPATQRADLAVPLNECGSGVGQVLAILYVVMTSDHPRVILVDEPQSFLHPGAVRKLIDILKQFPQHQYILATHSPTAIVAADPVTMTMSRATDAETSLQVIDPRSAKDLQTYLLEIGARLSDVFGADDILWVEGQTEETCFPQILKILTRKQLRGTAILGITQTSDITGRDKKKVLEMYQRLSAANSLLPPAVAFVLDRECLTDQQVNDIARFKRPGDGRDLVHFLPHRMYENYLLSAEAIAAVANSIRDFRPQQVQADEVQQLLDAKLGDRRYYCPGLQAIPNDRPTHVDGARILKDIFGELSENRVYYQKMTHSVAITDWILQHRREEFRDLATWLVGVLPENHGA
jgi:energy-coupling factor transporter ATP-binding protein EcfA2